MTVPMKEKIRELFKEYYNDQAMPVVELEDKVLALFDVAGLKEQSGNGYKIVREQIGKYGTSSQYRCGKFIAPRKRDVINEIERLLEKKVFLELELSKLERA